MSEESMFGANPALVKSVAEAALRILSRELRRPAAPAKPAAPAAEVPPPAQPLVPGMPLLAFHEAHGSTRPAVAEAIAVLDALGRARGYSTGGWLTNLPKPLMDAAVRALNAHTDGEGWKRDAGEDDEGGE